MRVLSAAMHPLLTGLKYQPAYGSAVGGGGAGVGERAGTTGRGVGGRAVGARVGEAGGGEGIGVGGIVGGTGVNVGRATVREGTTVLVGVGLARAITSVVRQPKITSQKIP